MPEHLVSTALLAAAEAERDQWRAACAALAAAYLADAAPPSPLTRADLRLCASGHAFARIDALADAVLGLLEYRAWQSEPPPAMDEAALAAARAQALGLLNLEEGE